MMHYSHNTSIFLFEKDISLLPKDKFLVKNFETKVTLKLTDKCVNKMFSIGHHHMLDEDNFLVHLSANIFMQKFVGKTNIMSLFELNQTLAIGSLVLNLSRKSTREAR
jgi:hypothetical protein